MSTKNLTKSIIYSLCEYREFRGRIKMIKTTVRDSMDNDENLINYKNSSKNTEMHSLISLSSLFLFLSFSF